MTKVNIRTIAKKSGVSIGSVSRALNGQGGLNDQTQEHILKIAKELGYDFSRLKKAKIENVLFLLHERHHVDSAMMFYSEILHGVEFACRKHQLKLSFWTISPTTDIKKGFSERKPDGVLACGFFEPEIFQFLSTLNIPTVLIDHSSSDFSSVYPNNEKGAYLATQYLIKKGYQRIAYLSSTLANENIRLREKGYRQALFDAGILISPAYESIGSSMLESEQSFIEATKALLELTPPPDAIFACNDFAAMTAMKLCLSKGLKIPQDIAIIGFDNIEAGKMIYPPLSTISVDKFKMGEIGTNILMEFNQVKEVTNHCIDVDLLIRESC